ncbi:MAG: GumC family protein [Gemmataceae bacterium]
MTSAKQRRDVLITHRDLLLRPPSQQGQHFLMQLNLSILWRFKIILMLFTLVGVVGGWVYLKVVPPTYQAQARVLIEPQEVGPESMPLPRIDPEFLPTQAETIRSPVTIRRALQSLTVTPPPWTPKEEFDPVASILKSLRVTPILKANVVTIGYRSTNSEESLKVISKIIEAYQQHVVEKDVNKSRATIHVVASREKNLREDVLKAQKDYIELRRTSPLLGQGRDAVNQAVAELNRLRDQLVEVRRKRVEMEARFASLLTETSHTSAPPKKGSLSTLERSGHAETTVEDLLRFADPEDTKKLQDLKEQLQFARSRFTQLTATYKSGHPEIISAQAEVDGYETLLRQRTQDLFKVWRGRLEITRATEKALDKALKKERKEVQEAEIYLVREEFLKENLTKVEKLHSATLAQLAKIQSVEQAIAEGRNSIEVRVLDEPKVLEDMTWPKPKLLLPASAGLGFLAGFILVLLLGGASVTTQVNGTTRSGPVSAASTQTAEVASIPNESGNKEASGD